MNEKYVEKAVEEFRVLLTEQLERQEYISADRSVKDFSKKNPIIIGICGGDGIGPIITREGERILRVLLKEELEAGRIELRTINGLTVENRMMSGKAIPDDVMDAIRSCDVLLKGPTATPHGGTLESANVAMRRELDLYANVRPINLPQQGLDWTFFRENSEGEYVLGSRGIEIPEKLAMDFKVTTDAGTRRIARMAFEYAKNNEKNRVAIVTKANIMKKTDGNFSRICHEVAEEYPGIIVDDWYIDIMTANLINKDLRSQFQVFLLPNLYGDIITDEAAQIQGGVGTAGSANIGDQYAMFEAIHGSAPRLIEQGLGLYANPCSIFKAIGMLLRHIGRIELAERLERALHICCEQERKVIADGSTENATCREFTDYLIEKL